MKSIDRRAALCWLAALALAVLGYLGGNAWALALTQAGRGTTIALYAVNAVQQTVLFAAPALLVLAARPGRWRLFCQTLRPLRLDKSADSALLAVSGSVVVSILAYLWSLWLQNATGYTGRQDPLPDPENLWQWAVVLLTVVVTPALCEELFFRGLIQGALCRRLGRAGLWLAALVFAALHFRWDAFPSLLLIGLVLGKTYQLHGYWSSALLHALYNAVVVVLASREVGVTLGMETACIAACVVAARRLLRKEPEDEIDGTGL